MADAPKPIFDMGKFLESKGMMFAGIDDAGNYNVISQDGRQGTVDVAGMSKAMGIDTSKMDIELNTPDTAQDSSPVGIIDRAKLALGNTRGQVGYLKSKYDDAGFVDGKGLVVKDRGVWRRVDQSSMDPWELTQDIVEGAVSILPTAAAATAGAAKGFAMGGGPASPITAAVGSIVGAGVGGATGEAGRTSLGRWAGTYDATPEEQLADIGKEFLINAGGQTVLLGAKLGVGQLVKAAKNLKRVPGASKEVLVDAVSGTTGAKPSQVETLFEQPHEVGKELAAAGAGKLSPEAVQNTLKDGQIELINTMAKKATAARTQRFGEALEALGKQMPKDAEESVGGVIQEAMKDMSKAGWGQTLTKGTATDTGLVDAAGKSIFKSGEEKAVFELFSHEHALANLMNNMEGHVLSEDARASVLKMVSTVNSYMNLGTAKGETLSNVLMKIKAAVNQTSRDLAGPNESKVVQRFVGDFRNAVVNRVTQTYEKYGLAKPYIAIGDRYERFAAAAHEASLIAHSKTGVEAENFLNRILQGNGRNRVYVGLSKDMVELLGDEGASLMNNIELKHSAQGFTTWLPPRNATSQPGLMNSLGRVASAPLGPKAVVKQAQYAKKLLGMVQGMSPATRMKWLQNPVLVRAAVQEVVKAPFEEDATKQQLLNQAGIPQR